MSTTGDRSVGQPHPEVIEMMIRAAPTERDQVIADDLKWHALIGSPDYPMGEQYRSSRTAAAFDRCYDPAGRVRQVAAVLAGGDRSEALGTISVPTVVIHGSADKLIDPSGGRATAAAIRGAKLVEVEGMGHDLPPSLWPLICREILANVALAKGA
jgi:pimeloyl-ACP methyl ester carboxylesterase